MTPLPPRKGLSGSAEMSFEETARQALNAPLDAEVVDRRPQVMETYCGQFVSSAAVLSFADTKSFKPGDLLMPLPGMRNWAVHAIDAPVVFLKHLDTAKKAYSGQMVTTFDSVIRALDYDGDFVEVLADSRRFQKFVLEVNTYAH